MDASKFDWKYMGPNESPLPVRRTCGYAAASDLGLQVGELPFRALTEGSCDLGCVLENPRTGNTMTFILDNFDEEEWIFSSDVDPQLKLKILNDLTNYER